MEASPRFKKFEYYYKHILQKPVNQEILEALGREFNQLALTGVLTAPFVDGALETLEQLKKQGIPAFVVSGTPDEEIKAIVEKKNLAHYFLEVHGSPRTKQEIVQDIADRYGYRLGDCLLIGDAMTDYEAAKVCETMFLGIVKEGEQSPFPEGTEVSGSVQCDIRGSTALSQLLRQSLFTDHGL